MISIQEVFSDPSGSHIPKLIENREAYGADNIVKYIEAKINNHVGPSTISNNLSLCYYFLGSVPLCPKYLNMDISPTTRLDIVIGWLTIEVARPIESNYRLEVETILINFITTNMPTIADFAGRKGIKYKSWGLNLFIKRLIIYASIKTMKGLGPSIIMNQEWLKAGPAADSIIESVNKFRGMSSPLDDESAETLKKVYKVFGKDVA
jgi:hypothetical protein